MAVEIMLPTLGESIAEATLLRWLKRAGDEVKRGEELAEIETEKAAMPIESPADGVLLAVLADEGSVIVTRQVLAVVGQPGEKWDVAPAPKEEFTLPQAVVSQAPRPSLRSTLTDERQRISPRARKMAEELGIDVQQVPPSRSGARVVTADVQRYAETLRGEAAASVHLPSHRVLLTRVGKVMAERMLASARLIPQFSASIEVDAAQLLTRREQFRRQVAAEGGAVTLTALLAYLVVRALRQHPLLNARFDGDSVVVYDTFNIGVAVTTPPRLDGARASSDRGNERHRDCSSFDGGYHSGTGSEADSRRRGGRDFHPQQPGYVRRQSVCPAGEPAAVRHPWRRSRSPHRRAQP